MISKAPLAGPHFALLPWSCFTSAESRPPRPGPCAAPSGTQRWRPLLQLSRGLHARRHPGARGASGGDGVRGLEPAELWAPQRPPPAAPRSAQVGIRAPRPVLSAPDARAQRLRFCRKTRGCERHRPRAGSGVAGGTANDGGDRALHHLRGLPLVGSPASPAPPPRLPEPACPAAGRSPGAAEDAAWAGVVFLTCRRGSCPSILPHCHPCTGAPVPPPGRPPAGLGAQRPCLARSPWSPEPV